jgi:MFS family permease
VTEAIAERDTSLRRLFLLVAAVVLVDTMFYAAITPLLPDYQDRLGLSKSGAGILAASYAAGTLLASLPGGWLAARAGVKPTVVTGLSLMAGAGMAFAFSDQAVVLVTARFLQGVGGALSWAGGLAWLLGASPADRRGRLIGSALAAAIAGVLLGPVLGGLATVVGAAPVFGSVAAVGVGLVVWALLTPSARPATAPRWHSLAAAVRTPAVVAGVWLVTLPALFSGTLNVLAPLRLDELGASGVAVGAVFLTAAALEAVLARLFGAVSDRRGRLVPIRIGLIAITPFALALPVAGSWIVVAALVVGAVGALAAFWAPAMALLTDSAEAAGLDLGFAMAFTNLAWAGGQVAGGAGGSRLADATTDLIPFAVLAGLCVGTFVVLARLRPRRPLSSVDDRS